MASDRRSFFKILGGFGLMSLVPSSILARSESYAPIPAVKQPAAHEAATKVIRNDSLLQDSTYENILQQIYKPYTNIKTPKLNILHFSDIHGDQVNLSRIVAFRNKYAAYLNDTLHTGDNHYMQWSDGFDFWKNVKGTENILNCVGNHDCAVDRTKKEGWWAAGKENVYHRFFEPYISNWKVKQPEQAAQKGSNYYYKDYAKQHIRLIVLDGMFYDADQNRWFREILDSARHASLQVVVASHFPTSLSTGNKNCIFDSFNAPHKGWETDWTGYGLLDSKVPEAVKEFMEKGGTFICYLCGHTHTDLFRTLTAYPHQLMIGAPNAGHPKFAFPFSHNRVEGTRSQDLFNILSIDPTLKYLIVARIGCNYDSMGRHQESILYNYADHEIIYQN
jgi:predicted MPP superfamily phosphohydrolase